MLLLTTTILSLLSLTTALPSGLRARSEPTTQLIAIAPTSGSCTGATFPAECATASDAVMPIIDGFAQYNIKTAAEQAALLSWMAFESGDFKYNMNHFPAPGNPGQGTRCMMSPTFVAKYAASIPAVSAQAAAQAANPAAVLALVSSDQYSFASAAWFLSTQCTSAVRTALQTGSQAGWEGWITGCVGTTVTSDRQAYWTRAVQQLGV